MLQFAHRALNRNKNALDSANTFLQSCSFGSASRRRHGLNKGAIEKNDAKSSFAVNTAISQRNLEDRPLPERCRWARRKMAMRGALPIEKLLQMVAMALSAAIMQ
jgi:hypothetical protein